MTEHEPLQPLTDSQREMLEEAVTGYQVSLTRAAAEYLVGRGLEPATVRTFRLGVVDDPMPGHERRRGWLAIPYLDRDGRPLYIRFRRPPELDYDESIPKYLGMEGEPIRMFNVGAIHRAETEIHVTEGEFDAMVLSQLGLHAVALPGAVSFAGRHRRMLAGFNKIWVWGDPDDAGADFVNRVMKALPRARGVRLSKDVGDVTDTYLALGAEGIFELFDREEHV